MFISKKHPSRVFLAVSQNCLALNSFFRFIIPLYSSSCIFKWVQWSSGYMNAKYGGTLEFVFAAWFSVSRIIHGFCWKLINDMDKKSLRHESFSKKSTRKYKLKFKFKFKSQKYKILKIFVSPSSILI